MKSNKTQIFAYFLGYLGAIPFVILSGLILFQIEIRFVDIKSLLLLYGIIIINFLGGIHWGRLALKLRAKDHNSPLFWLFISVVPSIFSIFIVLLNNKFSVILLIFLFSFFCVLDLYLVKKNIWLSWMKNLRLILSSVAILSLMILLFTK